MQLCVDAPLPLRRRASAARASTSTQRGPSAQRARARLRRAWSDTRRRCRRSAALTGRRGRGGCRSPVRSGFTASKISARHPSLPRARRCVERAPLSVILVSQMTTKNDFAVGDGGGGLKPPAPLASPTSWDDDRHRRSSLFTTTAIGLNGSAHDGLRNGVGGNCCGPELASAR